jgi:hypothetical protein
MKHDAFILVMQLMTQRWEVLYGSQAYTCCSCIEGDRVQSYSITAIGTGSCQYSTKLSCMHCASSNRS